MNPFSIKPQQLPSTPLLGLDFGKKVVGIAYFHPEEDAEPIAYCRILYQSDEQVLNQLEKILKSENIKNIILGLPLYPDGNPSLMSKRVLVFAERLKTRFPEINLFSQDESGSSQEAQENMKNSAKYHFTVDLKKLDEESAIVILQRFLHSF